MKFSVVVATRNRANLAIKTIQKIDSAAKKHQVEVIVVDNNSSDQTIKKISALKYKNIVCRVIKETRLGASFCRNLGMKLAKYEIVVIIDDDVIIPQNFFEKLASKWQEYPEARVISYRILAESTGKIITKKQKKLIRSHSWCFTQCDWDRDDFELPLGEIFLAASFSYRKSPNRPIQLFDERLGVVWNNILIGGEDVELTARLLLSNQKIIFTSNITVFHQINTLRLKRSYLMRRYILTGWEKLLIENIIEEKFPGKYQSFNQQLKQAFLNLLLLRKIKDNLRFFSSTLRLATILSYNINRPLLHKEKTERERALKQKTFDML